MSTKITKACFVVGTVAPIRRPPYRYCSTQEIWLDGNSVRFEILKRVKNTRAFLEQHHEQEQENRQARMREIPDVFGWLIFRREYVLFGAAQCQKIKICTMQLHASGFEIFEIYHI